MLSTGLLFSSAVLFAFCYYKSFLSASLLPGDNSPISWQIDVFSDSEVGGASTIELIEVNEAIRYRYLIDSTLEFPYVGPKLIFNSTSENQLVDLARYSSVSFDAKCDVENEMTFHLHSFDNNVTTKDRFLSYRIAEKDFTCRAERLNYVIALDDLRVPLWWLKKEKQDVTDGLFWPEKTHAISFDNDRRGVLNKALEAEISNIVLIGRNWGYLWFAGVGIGCAWLVLFVYLFRLYTISLTASVKARIAENKPLIAYQQLSIKPHKDREKKQLLKLMAEEFANPNMSLEYTRNALGMNKNKINMLLKNELGLTFISYLNKLRLAEAAKRLAEENNQNISEIAFSVGYNNISYFNRLFKSEYDCTPKKFKESYKNKKV